MVIISNKWNTHKILSLVVCIIILIGVLLPVSQAADTIHMEGFDKGPSYKSVVPLKKTTFVNFDEESYLDDYAYLAAVPTAVFDDGDRLFSNPLLFYQDEYPVKEDKERSLNARQGLDYFMEDWMSYCNGQLDQMTLINVPKNKLDNSWKAKEYTTIEYDNPYDIANKLALNEWSYSDDAVIAIVNEEPKTSDLEDIVISGEVEGSLSSSKIKEERFVLPQINIIAPQFEDFTIPEGYKYLKARVWYPCFYFGFNLPAFFVGVNISVPAGDPNLELFCKHENKWMQVSATFGWNQKHGMDVDYTGSYIYEPGPWRVSITDVPTHSTENGEKRVHRHLGIFEFGRYGNFFDALKNLRNVQYNVDVTMFPGINVEIPDLPMYGCADAEFKLTWDNPNVNLGFSLIGPGGEEILSAFNESRNDQQEMHLGRLGQCLDGERYSICVFAMDDISTPIEFNVEYTWKQGITKSTGDSLTSATEGSILGSVLDAPLLYASSSQLSHSTKEILYTLGVENIYVVDIGGNIEEYLLKDLKYVANVKKHFMVPKDIYDFIRGKTGSNDVVFSTLDPWSYWYVNEKKPADEFPGALFLGPAAYIAAHHGSPLLIVDNHPRLSSSVIYHTEFWKRMAGCSSSPKGLPSVAEMYITGMRTYDFLKDYDFDKEGMETIITVAGEYDIGISWDRVFFGKATPGRFFGSPVDTSYWISRSVFYPALIFVNPAMNPNGIELINGSESKRRFPWWSRLGLKITREPQEETFRYPMLHTYLCYNHRFNERASKYWGWKYTCADGMIPGESPSFEAIDNGVRKKYEGKSGAFFPDFISTEIIPLYSSRAGYSNAYSTSFSAVMDNLNKGVIIWMGTAHGGAGDGGALMFWNPKSSLVHEENPWRGYEWYLGSTEEPDTMTMESYGLIPMLFGNPTGKGLTGHGVIRTAFDYAPAKKPILDTLGTLPVIKWLMPKYIRDTQDYYDGVVGSVMLGTIHLKTYSGCELDDALENLHSAGVINGCCLLSTKYFHLTLIRHGSVFQTLDPWPTSWYSTWQSDIPRNLALGDTVGEAFVKGIRHVGIFYLEDQWWADIKQNVVYFGDPDLRPFTPGTEYSDENYWEEDETESLRYDADFSVDGHMPFGATSYPNEKQPATFLEEYILVIIAIVVIALLVITVVYMSRRKYKNNDG